MGLHNPWRRRCSSPSVTAGDVHPVNLDDGTAATCCCDCTGRWRRRMRSSHRWRTKRTTAADLERRRVYASPEHRRLRATIQAKIDAGVPTHCWRCGAQIRAHAWHLGHADNDRSVYRGAECVPCNLKAAARKGNAVQRARKATVRPVRRRDWYGT